MINFTMAGMKELHAAMEERLELVKETVDNAVKATAELGKVINP